MVCDINFKPHLFKVASFSQSPTSQKFIVDCSNHPKSPIYQIPYGHKLTDNSTGDLLYFRRFDVKYHARFLTPPLWIAIFWMLHILNSHSCLKTLLPRHQWRVKFISIPQIPPFTYKNGEETSGLEKKFTIIFQLCEIEQRISYDCARYMDKRYGIEKFSGHELDGGLE
ncbi:hypothetical protein TWF788_011031 [Orbilia oligospora]|uniref:Uncharacterized protein n=1 Tax=Orbilia oligospora TaxID=2813651 RepID=A0A7C8K979_ORBOL|nr:hypothetical protein TWF788_011031 [Orbilia oligospora]